MNLSELPFLDMGWTNRVAGITHETFIMCLNRVAWFDDHVINQRIEDTCEALITHETIHATLNEVIGFSSSPWWDTVDDDPNYIISMV